MLDSKKCCLKKYIELEVNTSEDLYCDLQPDTLKLEYENTKSTSVDLDRFLESSPELPDSDVEYVRKFKNFLTMKRESLKNSLAKATSKYG